MNTTTELKQYFTNNGNKKAYFVRWYVDSDKTEENYNKNCKGLTNVEYKHAMNEWLIEEEVQNAIKEYLKAQRNIKMLNIYNSMYKKAIEKGDVNSARWCEDFFKSDFFQNTTDEIDDYLSGINIPALKDGDK